MPAVVTDKLQKGIDRFVGSLTCGIDFFKQAGTQLVALKRQDEHVFDAIVEQVEWMTHDMLETLHEIGLGNLEPRTLLLPARVAARVAEMPIEQQRAACDSYKSGSGYDATEFAPGRVTRRRQNEIEAGVFFVTVLNGKAFVKQAGKTNRKPQRVVLGSNGEALVRFVKA